MNAIGETRREVPHDEMGMSPGNGRIFEAI